MTEQEKNCISHSTARVEYIDVSINFSIIIWIKKVLNCIQEEVTKPITMYCDNISGINISKNLMMHAKMKHIYMKYHYLRKKVQEK